MTSPEEAAVRLEHIAIIGAGLAGRSFSRHLLAHGYQVTLEDVLPSNLRCVTTELEATPFADRKDALHLASTVEEAVRSADLVIDFVPDELESKLEILSMIDRMAPPRTVLLTPTDVLSISDLASCTYRPNRCFGISGLSRHTAFSPQVTLSLLYPGTASVAVLSGLETFLFAIGLPFRSALDPHPSLLTGR
jgi:3-hydroxybutyryl-CoA dehydrogenase